MKEKNEAFSLLKKDKVLLPIRPVQLKDGSSDFYPCHDTDPQNAKNNLFQGDHI